MPPFSALLAVEEVVVVIVGLAVFPTAVVALPPADGVAVVPDGFEEEGNAFAPLVEMVERTGGEAATVVFPPGFEEAGFTVDIAFDGFPMAFPPVATFADILGTVLRRERHYSRKRSTIS